MGMRIVRNAEGNCINFVGSSNPAYFNACLSAQINSLDSNAVDVINDIRTANDENTQYEFYSINYTEFLDKDGNAFADAQATVDYINANANVLGLSDSGTSLTGINVDFRLDDTSTSIIMDNGSAFGVNTIKAVADADGTIHIHAIGGGIPTGSESASTHKHFEGLEHGRVSVDSNTVSGGLNDVVNTLNELFTVGAFEAVVIADPHSTMVADVSGVDAGYTIIGNTAVDPIGDDVFANSSSGNLAGLKSTETIDQAGEYFTFDIRGEGQIGFGLIHTDSSYSGGFYAGSATYADPSTFAISNSAHYGFQFSHWFHPTPNGSWTNYGASTGFIYGSGWSNWESQDEWLAGNPVKMRVGIDENGYIAISTLQDDGTTWILHARSSYIVQEGASFHLGVKSASPSARVASAPKVHLLEAEAPVMQFRYIESPDGNFEYPLFATEEEANYYDSQNGGTGSGSSHTHTYTDDPTATTWYMPDNGGTMTDTSAPAADLTLGQAATYTEITSLTNADLTPPQFSATSLTQEEGTAVNIQVTPAGATWSSSVSISPSGSGLVYDGYSLVQGTLTDVGADTVYTITVTRANSYGSSVGTMTVTATDVAPVSTNDTPWTKALDFSGSNEHSKQVSSSMYVQPLQMNGLANQVDLGTRSQGETSNNTSSRPWATAVVFKSDGYNGNQMIWNQGEGSLSGSDNIFVNVGATGHVNLGWGREGVGYNMCRIASNISSSTWYGISIAHNGVRLGGNNASASNLADCFDIRIMSSADSFASISSNLSIAANWTSTGQRMDRTVAGDFTIGGRGTGYSYRGKIASMVVTTLISEGNYTSAQLPAGFMPDADQAKMMITDPVKWIDDYKVRLSTGNPNGLFRKPAERFATSYYTPANAYQSTYVWLMGDGTSDSYSNGVRNHVYPSDQNHGKLQLNSMVSNDIQTVNINGLT
jgi:hypothetical protein